MKTEYINDMMQRLYPIREVNSTFDQLYTKSLEFVDWFDAVDGEPLVSKEERKELVYYRMELFKLLNYFEQEIKDYISNLSSKRYNELY
tara:strand:- start:3249 stop:3515 length:267 start_codon:yes stop_codon:yes gene_type:complete